MPPARGSRGCVYDHVRGISVGRSFKSRESLATQGLHACDESVWEGPEGAYSIIYDLQDEDSQESDQGSQFIFHVESPLRHQSDSDWGVRALLQSESNNKPIRVIRSCEAKSLFAPVAPILYRYDGLYYIQSHWSEKLEDNAFFVIRFLFDRLPDQPSLPEPQPEHVPQGPEPPRLKAKRERREEEHGSSPPLKQQRIDTFLSASKPISSTIPKREPIPDSGDHSVSTPAPKTSQKVPVTKPSKSRDEDWGYQPSLTSTEKKNAKIPGSILRQPATMSLSASFVSIFLEGECPFCAEKLSQSIIAPQGERDDHYFRFVNSLQKHIVHLRGHRHQFLKNIGSYSDIIKANTNRIHSAVEFLEEDDVEMNETTLPEETKAWILSLRTPFSPSPPEPPPRREVVPKSEPLPKREAGPVPIPINLDSSPVQIEVSSSDEDVPPCYIIDSSP